MSVINDLRNALKLLDDLSSLIFVNDVEDYLYMNKLVDDLRSEIKDNLFWRECVGIVEYNMRRQDI